MYGAMSRGVRWGHQVSCTCIRPMWQPGEEPPIGDGDAMRVAGEVAPHRERPFCVDDPLGLAPAGDEVAPGGWGGEGLTRPLPAESATGRRMVESGEEGAAEQATEDTYREEELGTTREPGWPSTASPPAGTRQCRWGC
jgi:hypothetical protein